MSVVLRKEEKVKAIFEKMTNPEDIEEFKSLFMQMYPDDFAKIQKIYWAEEKKDKKGKGHPMPLPEIYLSNMFKVAKSKIKE